MLLSFESRLQGVIEEIEALRKQISDAVITPGDSEAMTQYIDLYFRLHELSPNSRKLCMAIVKFIAQCSFEYDGSYKIFDKIKECHEVIVKLSTEEELVEANYLIQYEAAKKNISLVLAN